MENNPTPPAHTEHPWSVATPGNGGVQRLILSADGRLLAIVGDFPDGDPEEVEANARLMAASPGLLEALIAVDQWSQDSGVDYPSWIVESAIREATGTTISPDDHA